MKNVTAIISTLIFVSSVLVVQTLEAGLKAPVVPVSPRNGETVETLTDTQLKVFAGETKEARNAILKTLDKHAVRHDWKCQRPLVLKWRTTEGEKGRWRVRLSRDAGFTDFRDFWPENDKVKSRKDEATGMTEWSYKVPLANLELGRTYWWDVWSSAACDGLDCGITYPDKCRCGKVKSGHKSAAASFTTSPQAPRWIAWEWKDGNFRDLGGWRTVDGGRVRTGLIFRSAGLNEGSVSGLAKGRSRLTVEDRNYMTGKLGIKTDLDLRTRRETGGMESSPLGAGVRFVQRSSPFYSGMFTPEGRKTMGENFRLFCDRKNYPICFHCAGGADRTGSLAYVLNGLLGVGKEDLERDYESTFYPEMPWVDDPKHGRGTQHFDKGFGTYEGPSGGTLQHRIALYLLDCGVTRKELQQFRDIMLEPPSAQ